jgi:hypothetical protein
LDKNYPEKSQEEAELVLILEDGEVLAEERFQGKYWQTDIEYSCLHLREVLLEIYRKCREIYFNEGREIEPEELKKYILKTENYK